MIWRPYERGNLGRDRHALRGDDVKTHTGRRQPQDGGGRGQSSIATSQENAWGTRSNERSLEYPILQFSGHPDFRLPAPRTVSEYTSLVLKHPVCETLLTAPGNEYSRDPCKQQAPHPHCWIPVNNRLPITTAGVFPTQGQQREAGGGRSRDWRPPVIERSQ